MKRSMRFAPFVLSCALLLASLAACTGDGEGSIGDFLPGGNKEPTVSDPEYQRTPPDINQFLASFGGQNVAAYDDGAGTSAVLDMTNVNRGYVAVNANSPNKGLFIVNHYNDGGEKDNTYTYLLDTAGKDQFYPLTMGDGTYEFLVYIFAYTDEAGSDQYYTVIQQSVGVALESEFGPYLVNSAVVDYGPDSAAVALSYELAQHAQTDLEVIQQVYYWIEENIDYDTEKAAGMQDARYVPNLDQILADKKGICYDYASLAAAMLRANGIPTKMIFGYVDTGEGNQVYHAWNMIWTEAEGWIAVKVPSAPGDWARIDLTFAASGRADIAQFIGNAENYMNVSVH